MERQALGAVLEEEFAVVPSDRSRAISSALSFGNSSSLLKDRGMQPRPGVSLQESPRLSCAVSD